MIKTAIALCIALFQLSLFSPPVRSAGFTLNSLSATEVPFLSPLREPPPAVAKVRFDHTGLPYHLFTEETVITPVLVRAINTVHTTLDVALYNLQLSEVVSAMIAARDRGVRVRVVLDDKHVFPKRNADIQRLLDSGMDVRLMRGRGRSGSMHNKYAIFDGVGLQTGSANWTWFAETASYENMLFLYDPYTIAGYQANFEWMWNQSRLASSPDAQAPPAGPIPTDPSPSLYFNGAALPRYAFSPRGGTEAAIIKAIDAARSEIKVAMFTLTSEPIMSALTRAAARGVSVKLMHNAGSSFPFFHDALKSRFDLRFSRGRTERGQMHNKFAVLDGSLLINGAFNWSATAENTNAENTIFTMEPYYVQVYAGEFDRLFAAAKAP
ncbi:MAG: phospholipase D/transphosphatidylase [Elusimicrobia bacterium]|nr:MAG: phospholipase D/transphosphatidylase [Elusimicrobiota bacterium]KAF0154763.1 MAG: phospholipase D/transphosphatidylase [Elusimicrobiota bacterium]